MNFNPRSPCGERRGCLLGCSKRPDFNPRSPCGERLRAAEWVFPGGVISIHAPRVGSDASAASVITQGADISIHAPRVGSDTVFQRPRDGAGQFQSTLPVWGATGINPDLVLADDSFQSTLPVWGATGKNTVKIALILNFNPRSPCGERRQFGRFCGKLSHFNPRSPCGERPQG